MWSAISKIFAKNNSAATSDSSEQIDAAPPPQPQHQQMDRGDRRQLQYHDSTMDETFVTKLAKQRASMKWLLSKAFNNKVPENLKEPFYRDHENQEHLKPQIVGALANAEIYCLALGNIYSDPNYHNLNHWAILQTLARKGVYVTEPSDSQLTETTLIQTNPLRMSAHMAVIESIMLLYAREVVTADRVLAAVQRFSHGRYPAPAMPENHEEGLLLWVSHACNALRKRIEDDDGDVTMTNGGQGDKLRPPEFPPIKEMKDLCDGIGLGALISYYCPDELHWSQLKISSMGSVQESLHNMRLVQDFCTKCLPACIFHLLPEDVTYMRDSMKQNLIVFLADLFNVMEIHPAKCVRYPGMDKFNSVSRSTPAHTPVRKANSLQQSMSEMSEDSLRRGSEDSFVVHRGKNIPTLSSVIHDEPLVPARLKTNKEKQNHDSKADERGEMAAGKPSNWEESRKSSFAGRRSRRNSMTDDSQLTIENFGGSQDNINFIGRNPDKEVGHHGAIVGSVTRKISAPSFPVALDNPAVRSSLQDAKGSFQLGYDFDNGCEEKKDNGSEKLKLKRQLSSDDISFRTLANKENLLKDLVDGESNRMSFAELGKLKEAGIGRGIHLVYMNDKEDYQPQKSSFLNKLPGNGSSNGGEKKTTFAALPNTTTWQQQQSSHLQHHDAGNNGAGDEHSHLVMNSQLTDVRLKLEEKRRQIESEKRRMEVAMNKQRQKVGKAAFLQAVAKEIHDDASTVERKWLDESQPFIEPRRTPDLENMDLEQYQQSIAQMNSSLHDIQSDIQRLASQQTQMQAAQQQNLIAQQQRQIQVLQQQYRQIQSPPPQQQHQQPSYTTQHSYNAPIYNPPPPPTQQLFSGQPLQSSASAPHIPQTLYNQQQQFFLHDHQQQPPPTPPIRRTWAQQQPTPPPASQSESYAMPQPELRTWGKPMSQNVSGFMLHDTMDRGRFINESKYQNGSGGDDHGGGAALQHSNSFTLSQQHLQQQQQQQHHYGTTHSTPSASPQHRNVHRQISQLLDEGKRVPVSLQQMDSPPVRKSSSIIHAPIPAPPADDMEPQNISFIGNNSNDDHLNEGLSRLNITSGSRTYRIPSPTRPLISRNSFQPSPVPEALQMNNSSVLAPPQAEISNLANDPMSQKGFYISFDNEQPKRPKPPLRTKRGSPKKERSYVETAEETLQRKEEQQRQEKRKQLERELDEERVKKEEEERRAQRLIEQEREKMRLKREASQERQKVAAASTIIIGNDLENPDPDVLDEREKKKERIMMLSLQRRQQQEEAKARKEQEAHARREQEKAKEEERARKKEEQVARRAAILEQYKLKKAIEEAEKEGKTIDKSELLSSLKPAPKMRPKAASRPRPKTIHIDSGSVQLAEGMSSRGKKGSTSNLTANSYSSMKRDYYRGSQDSLADRSMSGLLYKDSPDDSRGMSPCHNANQTLGRRSSYKTSRDPSPAQVRGRPKYSSNQTFKGRKSSSLMNLYGSSTDQDSLAYRFGDTDSGLGRATPPRRAPSPGMGSLRHLPSPSGPGSLPGLMSKGRRVFDDGSSDISSTPSSMMDYNGPRLYKQPATKSNRSIILNAVEYCVFPGVVNREAKRRVLDEINNSESRHFLILFRDAGCQFRALYSYCPDREEVKKMYGTGPKQVNDQMFDKFFKYNSGGKCFSQVHTKHLTVTIDAFTIHNSLWQGKKVNLPNKKDMALVI